MDGRGLRRAQRQQRLRLLARLGDKRPQMADMELPHWTLAHDSVCNLVARRSLARQLRRLSLELDQLQLIRERALTQASPRA